MSRETLFTLHTSPLCPTRYYLYVWKSSHSYGNLACLNPVRGVHASAFQGSRDAPISQTFMICVNDTTVSILKQFLANRFSVIRMAFDEIRLMNYVPLRNPKSTLLISTFCALTKRAYWCVTGHGRCHGSSGSPEPEQGKNRHSGFPTEAIQ